MPRVPSRRLRGGGGLQEPREYVTTCISLYLEDDDRLERIVRAGFYPSRSAAVRAALEVLEAKLKGTP